MAKQLLLLRHGKSDWTFDCDDFDRPLKNRGEQGANKIGLWLKKNHLEPDFVLSSPAVRAIETTRIVVSALSVNDLSIVEERRIYSASRATLLTVLAAIPKHVNKLLLVGHNPDLEDLLLFLVKGVVQVPYDGKLLPTATIAHLQLTESWQGLTVSCAQLLSITRARRLVDIK